MPKPGWGAAVLGEPADLQDWVFSLKEPFDPWMEIYGGETALRSASFDGLDSAIAQQWAAASSDGINRIGL
jgi:hypothetical protein